MIIRVTLDTDAGTLSYSLQPGPGNSSTTASQWGVAFRDLKTVGTLFPAIALYMRHNEVMIRRVPPSQVRPRRVVAC